MGAHDPDDLAPRLKRWIETLYAHAAEGYSGQEGNNMPAKGGGAHLSDQKVRDAVSYMARQARHYRELDEFGSPPIPAGKNRVPGRRHRHRYQPGQDISPIAHQTTHEDPV
jgi:hypothetical protein